MNPTNKTKCKDSSGVSSQPREIVASLLTNNGDVALFKRSNSVRGGQGMWHCITGFLEKSCRPDTHIKTEISEETGLGADNLQLLMASKLHINDQNGQAWKIHLYHFETNCRQLTTNWEHDAAQWCTFAEVSDFEVVDWLWLLFGAANLNNYLLQKNQVAQDKTRINSAA